MFSIRIVVWMGVAAALITAIAVCSPRSVQVPFPGAEDEACDPNVARLLSVYTQRHRGSSEAKVREARKELLTMGQEAVPSLIVLLKRAANKDRRIAEPNYVSDYGDQLRAAMAVVAAVGDRRTLPALRVLARYDNKAGRVGSAIRTLLSRGSLDQLRAEALSDDDWLAPRARYFLEHPEEYRSARSRQLW